MDFQYPSVLWLCSKRASSGAALNMVVVMLIYGSSPVTKDPPLCNHLRNRIYRFGQGEVMEQINLIFSFVSLFLFSMNIRKL